MRDPKRIYVDTEYMYEGMFTKKRLPSNSDKKQIIQIAAVLYDHESGNELDHFDILVKPVFNKSLPPFFTELTGISDKMIDDKSVSFSVALNKFIKFSKQYPIWTFNNDYKVFLQNLEFHNLNNPFCKEFKRVKPLLKKLGIDPEQYSSGTLFQAAGLKLNGHVHYALHDVRSMSQAIHSLNPNIY